MNKKDRQNKLVQEALAKVDYIVRHIKNVQDNCLLLGNKLIENGEIELGVALIRNGLLHDNSKLTGIEFDHMAPLQPTKEETAKLKLRLAAQHHVRSNPHHAEYWGGIKNMPEVYLAEMASDFKARSEEMGTSVHVYIQEQATKRYGFSENDDVYKQIMRFVNMLCIKPFEQLNAEEKI
jgi:hypothetical protein